MNVLVTRTSKKKKKEKTLTKKNVFVHCCIIVERTDATSDKLRDAMCVQQKGA